MLQEESSNKIHISFVVAAKIGLVDDEEASVLSCWEEIFFCVELEDVVTELETERLDFLNHCLAGLLDVAESLAVFADQVGHVFLPLLGELLKNCQRNRKLR